MARDTRQKIIDAGLTLFASQWNEQVSVAHICRAAGISNGLFYFYFNSKEELFFLLQDQYYTYLSEALSELQKGPFPEILESFYSVLITLNGKNRKYLSLFRQGLYMSPVLENRVLELYRNTLSRILGKGLGQAEFCFLVGGFRFLLYRSLTTNLPFPTEALLHIITNGVFTKEPVKYNKIFEKKIRYMLISQEESPPERLVKAGIELFGEKGFQEVKISELCSRAEISVGLFYRYFKSKDELVERVVGEISVRLRKHINRNIGPRLSRIEQELRGINLFLNYFQNRAGHYRIIREAEFYLPEAVREYYDRFEAGYMKNLKDVSLDNKAASGNFLMGIAHFLGLSLKNVEVPGDLSQFIRDLGVLFNKGFIP